MSRTTLGPSVVSAVAGALAARRGRGLQAFLPRPGQAPVGDGDRQ